MSGLFDVGSIAAPGADFASTGPHLHVSVTDPTGKAIDPTTAKSFLLNRLLVGPNKTPLFAQNASGWQGAYTVTSPFGHREAPTAGATTDHQGTDFGVPQGTKLAWLSNPGDTYTPDKGFGSIQTTDPQGRPYTVKLLHTTPGGAVQSPGQAQQTGARPGSGGNIYNFFIGKSKSKDSQDPLNFLSAYLTNSSTLQSGFDPIQAVQSALFQTPNYMT
jgi:hypothetical protein